MEFANKEYLLLLILLVPYIAWLVTRAHTAEPTMGMDSLEHLRRVRKSLRQRMTILPPILRIVAFVALVLALARPQTSNSWKNKTVEGIDIMLAMDVSTSMLAEDLRPNRIEAAKQVAREFIISRPDDNIGLTIFAGEAFTQCPMTVDHASLLNMLQGVATDITQRGLIEDGTAVGMGLANAVSRLKDSKAKSKVIILLTDGSNNRGDISPMTAAEIARSLGVRVYTIGVGTKGLARYPYNVGGHIEYIQLPVEIDSETLQNIAKTCGGQFYRAQNTRELSQIYKEIDKLEKTKLNVKKYSRRYEAYQPLALVCVLALLLELIVRIVVLRRLP